MIEFEQLDVTIPLYIRGRRVNVYNVTHVRAKPRKHTSSPPPVVYVDVIAEVPPLALRMTALQLADDAQQTGTGSASVQVSDCQGCGSRGRRVGLSGSPGPD